MEEVGEEGAHDKSVTEIPQGEEGDVEDHLMLEPQTTIDEVCACLTFFYCFSFGTYSKYFLDIIGCQGGYLTFFWSLGPPLIGFEYVWFFSRFFNWYTKYFIFLIY